MNQPHIPPFHGNAPDNIHCLQACAGMAIEAFTGNRLDFPNLDELSGQSPGFYSWPLRITISLLDMGLEAKYIDIFNLNDFIQNPRNTLISFYGERVGTVQFEKSDIPRVREDAIALIEKYPHVLEYRTPDLTDIQNLLAQGYLLICNINAKKLAGKEGYSGHFVLVYGCTANTVTLHNPGLPPTPSQECSTENFLNAWSEGGDHYRSILAVRK